MSHWIRPLLAAAALISVVFACEPRSVFADDSTAVDSARLFLQLDANGDGAVSEDEAPAEKQSLLRRLVRTSDKNGDGRLSQDEFVAGLKGTDKTQSKDETSPADKDAPKKDAPKDNLKRPAAESSDEPAARRKRLAAGDGQGMAALIGRMDKNGDGKVTPDEVPEERRDRYQALLGRLDKNKDGALSKEEIASGRPGSEDPSGAKSETPPAGRPALAGAGGRDINQIRQRLKEADKNGDGKLSKEEMPERMAPLFDRLDKDSDGQVDGAELRAGLEQMRERAALAEKAQDLKDQEKKLDAKKANAKKQAKAEAAKKRQNKQASKKAKAAKKNAKKAKGADGDKKKDADGKPA